MSTLGTTHITLLDWANALDPNGQVAAVAELLNQSNEILLDMPFLEGNLPTGHKSSIRTGLPTAIWRQLYQGVPAGKSTRATVEDSIGMLETRSEVDKDLAELNGNTAAFRLSEAEAFIEAMNESFAETLMYGNTDTNPERFMGLAPRFSNLSGPANAQNIINVGGSGADNTSVWLVGWGKNSVHGIFPKGSKAGLYHEDLGLIDAFDASNNRYRAYADHWQWKGGLVVKDWRYVVRCANIDVSDLVASSGTQNAYQLIKAMLRAINRIPFQGRAKLVFYANRTVREMLAVQAMDKSANGLSIKAAAEQFGSAAGGSEGAVLSFFGIPVRLVDRITTTEARIV